MKKLLKKTTLKFFESIILTLNDTKYILFDGIMIPEYDTTSVVDRILVLSKRESVSADRYIFYTIEDYLKRFYISNPNEDNIYVKLADTIANRLKRTYKLDIIYQLVKYDLISDKLKQELDNVEEGETIMLGFLPNGLPEYYDREANYFILDEIDYIYTKFLEQ